VADLVFVEKGTKTHTRQHRVTLHQSVLCFEIRDSTLWQCGWCPRSVYSAAS